MLQVKYFTKSYVIQQSLVLCYAPQKDMLVKFNSRFNSTVF